LLNTEEEMRKVKATVPRIFDSIKNKRPWIFIGYSGGDPIFEHIQNLGRFDNGLYWVTYNDNNPDYNVKSFLETPNTNAFVIKGYDADSFMLKLNNELGLEQPVIVNKPFTSLKEMLNNIVDINDDDNFKGVKERLEISKKQVNEAILQFEEGKVEKTELLKKTSEIDLLKKRIINLIIKENYQKDNIEEIEKRAEQFNNKEINSLLAGLYSDWGTDLGNLAKTKEGKEAEELYNQAFEKYQKAIEFGGHCYNLSCMYALKGDNKNALYFLDESLEKNEITVDIVRKDEDWKNYLNNIEFNNVLMKYEK
jgi:tetratricopeptide (TPR) repeat protein